MVGLLCLAWPLAGRAQLNLFRSYRPGSYVLVATPAVRQVGKLSRSNDGTELLVKPADGGDKIKLSAGEIRSCVISNQRYITISDFSVGTSRFAGNTLVEKLDSGRVELLCYEHKEMVAGSPSGGMYGGGGAATIRQYLLHNPGTPNYIAVAENNFLGTNHKFEDSVRPFFTARPDLVALLDAHKVPEYNLPFLVHALNSGQLYEFVANPPVSPDK